jgi:2-C-methyl-D-erythritol 4-phosphate cytidylyltransferase
VKAGLDECDIDTRYVVVHDGARPCVTSDIVSEVVKTVKRVPAVTVGRKMTDTVKRVEKGTTVSETLDRDKLWCVQTPQAFQVKTLRAAYKALGAKDVTDDCQAVELAGESVKIVECRQPNIKITTVEDLQIAGALLK